MKRSIVALLVCLTLVGGGFLLANTVTAYSEVDEISGKMIDAIDNYSNIKATYKEELISDDKTIVTSVSLNKEKPRMKAKVSFSDGTITEYSFRENKIEIYDQKENKVVKLNYHPGKFDKPTVRKLQRNGYEVKVIRREIVPVSTIGLSGQALFPQFDVLSIFDKAKATVKGHESLLGRNVTVLEVIPQAEIQEKLADKLNYWVDSDTGIVLKKELVKNGQVVERVSALDIKIDKGVNDLDFKFSVPANVTVEIPKY